MPKLSTRSNITYSSETDYYYMMNSTQTADFRIQSQHIFGQGLMPSDSVEFNSIDLSNTISTGVYTPRLITSSGPVDRVNSNFYPSNYVILNGCVSVSGSCEIVVTGQGISNANVAADLPLDTDFIVPDSLAGTITAQGRVEMQNYLKLFGYIFNSSGGFEIQLLNLHGPTDYLISYFFIYELASNDD